VKKKKKMKKRYAIASIVILAMLALAAFSTPVMAQGCLEDIKTRDCAVTTSGFLNGTITNGSVRVLENATPHCEQNWTITLPPGEVVCTGTGGASARTTIQPRNSGMATVSIKV